MNIQWYPGHMTKALRAMQEDIKLIDLVIEITDARIPSSSRNPDIDKLAENKKRLVLLNKSDMADDRITQKWVDYYGEKGICALPVNSKDKTSLKRLSNAIKEVCKDKYLRDQKRGIKNTCIRAMVVGIPNVGKSTFINSFSGKSSAKTGNKPGVTKGKQWIKLNKELELLDTPGILWPKFDNDEVGKNLALIGSINDEILNTEELAASGIGFLKEKYPSMLIDRFSNDLDLAKSDYDILSDMALVRNYLSKGSAPDDSKMAKIFLEEFRNAKIGKFTMEEP